MENQHTIPITDGVGSIALVNGSYTVASSTLGYDNTSIYPTTQEITEDVNEYNFTIAATGTLTLHVSDDGTNIGTAIEGAKFARCDAEGNTYGEEITSDTDGNAVFNYVPFSATETAPTIYYKQTVSDGQHEFDAQLKNVVLTTQTHTIEVENPAAATRNFNFTDANYSGLPIVDGEIILS